MQMLPFPTNRPYDIVCLGRLAVDLYADQIGCSLEDASSFSKYLGGSSANIAFGTARLGLASAMLSRVGDEQNGRYLIDILQREGCETSQIQIDQQRLTGIVMLAIKDQHTFPLLFVRENCADMAIEADLIDENFIAQCRSLLITGTHLSTPKVLAASQKALALGKKHGLIRVLDIDYRPVLWGLTGRGDGETRYIRDDTVSQHLQEQLPHFELIIGTEEEWMIAGGIEGDLIACLRRARECTSAAFVVKRGALGCTIITGDIPANIDDGITVMGERIEVLNVLGAGDAFASGLMTGLLRGKSWIESATIANACGAIVVSRHGCAPAMPTPAELDYWFSGNRLPRPDQDPNLAHLHRVSVKRKKWEELFVLAFDHRSQFEELAAETGTELVKLGKIKHLLNQALQEIEHENGELQGKLGVLIDGRPDLGESALHAATGRGWWVGRPVELPGSRPLNFDTTCSVGSTLKAWPLEQVVKCLVFFHPEDSQEMRRQQEESLLEIWEATRTSGHELLLEVIPPKDKKLTNDDGFSVITTIKHFYELGLKPEWWKVPAMSSANWDKLSELINQYDPYCRGAVILGLSQPVDELIQEFSNARNPIVKGFMVGRSIWSSPAKAWLKGEINDDKLIFQAKTNFKTLIDGWKKSHPSR